MSARKNLAHIRLQAPLDDGAIPPPTGAAQAPDHTHAWPLIERARDLIARHLAEPPAAVDTLIFWCLPAWAHEHATVSPRLILHGRDPRADHARALRVLGWLAPNPRLISRATSYGVLDLLARERPTLLFDDQANAILGRRDMRALIAAGARRDAMFLGRRAPGGKTPFRGCAAPLALATCLTPPADVLAHAIVVPMTPVLVVDGAERPAVAHPPEEAASLRAGFEALAGRLSNRPLAPAEPLPAFLSAAARETWGPLFAIAQMIGGEAEAAMLAAASQFAAPEHLQPPDSPLALLRDIRALVGIDDQPVPSKFLVEQLSRDPDSPWTACDWGSPLTPRGLAQRLARFDLKPQVIHRDNAPSFRGYRSEALLTAFARYLNDTVAIALLQQNGREG